MDDFQAVEPFVPASPIIRIRITRSDGSTSEQDTDQMLDVWQAYAAGIGASVVQV